MTGREYHYPCCGSSPCRRLSDIYARSFIVMRDCKVACRHMLDHSCGCNRNVFDDCSIFKVQGYKKESFFDRVRKKALENRFTACYNTCMNTCFTGVPSDLLHLSRTLLLRTPIRRRSRGALFIYTYSLYHFFLDTSSGFTKLNRFFDFYSAVYFSGFF